MKRKSCVRKKSCNLAIETMVLSGMVNAECQHLQEMGNAIFKESIVLDKDALIELDHQHRKIL